MLRLSSKLRLPTELISHFNFSRMQSSRHWGLSQSCYSFGLQTSGFTFDSKLVDIQTRAASTIRSAPFRFGDRERFIHSQLLPLFREAFNYLKTTSDIDPSLRIDIPVVFDHPCVFEMLSEALHRIIQHDGAGTGARGHSVAVARRGSGKTVSALLLCHLLTIVLAKHGVGAAYVDYEQPHALNSTATLSAISAFATQQVSPFSEHSNTPRPVIVFGDELFTGITQFSRTFPVEWDPQLLRERLSIWTDWFSRGGGAYHFAMDSSSEFPWMVFETHEAAGHFRTDWNTEKWSRLQLPCPTGPQTEALVRALFLHEKKKAESDKVKGRQTKDDKADDNNLLSVEEEKLIADRQAIATESYRGVCLCQQHVLSSQSKIDLRDM